MTRHVLFLCTANYYRSRFAELLFNSHASMLELDWIADSRGIATELGIDNPGTISIHVVDRLRSLGIMAEDRRFPIQLRDGDMSRADLIVALDQDEHRPLLEKRFPASAANVLYWQVPDVKRATPKLALSMIERKVVGLIRNLSEQSTRRNH